MKRDFLCIADPSGRIACFLKAGEIGLEFVSGTPGADLKMGSVLADFAANGVHARRESVSPGRIDVDSVRIGTDDPRFLDCCAEEFRLRGWSASVYPHALADVWRRLYVLPLPEETRRDVAPYLDRMPVDALKDLQAQLDRTAADLEALAKS